MHGNKHVVSLDSGSNKKAGERNDWQPQSSGQVRVGEGLSDVSMTRGGGNNMLTSE